MKTILDLSRRQMALDIESYLPYSVPTTHPTTTESSGATGVGGSPASGIGGGKQRNGGMSNETEE